MSSHIYSHPNSVGKIGENLDGDEIIRLSQTSAFFSIFTKYTEKILNKNFMIILWPLIISPFEKWHEKIINEVIVSQFKVLEKFYFSNVYGK